MKKEEFKHFLCIDEIFVGFRKKIIVCFMTTRLIILINYYFVVYRVEAEYLRQQTSDSRCGYIYRLNNTLII